MMNRVAGYIKRKTMLYATRVEYGDYTMNHVLGCSHGCNYPCYAFMLKRRFGQISSYENWIKPFLVSNTMELLDKEIPRFKKKIKSVQLCFTTDPFMYGYNEIEEMSLAAIEKLNNAGIKCVILSKGILPLSLATYSKSNTYGITLISLDEDYRRRMEPGAAPYAERLIALKTLHDKGCKTWVSIEPYPTPNLIEQNLDKILNTVKFTDRIIFGRTNYSRNVTEFKGHRKFYNEQAKKVVSFCKSNGIQYYIKNGTISK